MQQSPCIRAETTCYDPDGYPLKGRGPLRRMHRAAFCKATGKTAKEIAGWVVRHTCDNRWCVNPEHLLLGTPKDNVQDQIDRGRFSYRKGEQAPYVKLTATDVLAIRQQYASGTNTVIELASKFHLSRTYIYAILNRTTWSHI